LEMNPFQFSQFKGSTLSAKPQHIMCKKGKNKIIKIYSSTTIMVFNK